MKKELMNKWIFFVFIFLIHSCIVIENQIDGLPPGKWRGIIKLDPTPLFNNPKGQPLEGTMDFEFEEVDAGELPFIFEISNPNDAGVQSFSILSGSEKIYTAPVQIGRDLTTAKDTINIPLENSDQSLTAIFEENIMEGWLAGSKFIAWYGKDFLFTQLKKEPLKEITGRYPIEIFFQGEEQKQTGELVLEQNENNLTGEILTNDLQLKLQGTIQRDKIYLSGINGSEAILLQGKIDSTSSVFGTYRDLKQRIGFWKITI
jgi:hypothetical protein